MPLKVSGLLTIQILLSLSAVGVMPLPPTLAEKPVSFLDILRASELRYGADSAFCAWASSGRRAARAIVERNTGVFMFFPPFAGAFGETTSRTKTVERPRLVSIVPLLGESTQTQNSNALYRPFAFISPSDYVTVLTKSL